MGSIFRTHFFVSKEFVLLLLQYITCHLKTGQKVTIPCL